MLHATPAAGPACLCAGAARYDRHANASGVAPALDRWPRRQDPRYVCVYTNAGTWPDWTCAVRLLLLALQGETTGEAALRRQPRPNGLHKAHGPSNAPADGASWRPPRELRPPLVLLPLAPVLAVATPVAAGLAALRRVMVASSVGRPGEHVQEQAL